MRVLGSYDDKEHGPLPVARGEIIALELTAAWTVEDSLCEDDICYYVVACSGCHMFHIKAKGRGNLSKEEADDLVNRLAAKDIVILDDEDMALFEATSDECSVVADGQPKKILKRVEYLDFR